MKKRFYLIFLIIIFLAVGFSVAAVSIGEKRTFNIDPDYDVINRDELVGVLQATSNRTLFYLDENWWDGLSLTDKDRVRSALRSLGSEFDSHIYPKLTDTFGHEAKPGIDNDNAIAILVHPMGKNSGGYFNPRDQYSKLQSPLSNQKEMVYLNSDYVTSSLAKSFLAHEFVHLISFNQKENLLDSKEEVWLNEARAEYAPTLLGYDESFNSSNLKSRVGIFLKNPSDSLTEWNSKVQDYGALNLFTQYLVDRYGIEVLVDSLHYKGSGIDSLNHALEKNGYSQKFSDVFTDWTLAVLLNNCSIGQKYCFNNPDLEGMKVTPDLNFLPATRSTLGVSSSAKNWQGNWTKFIGGNGTVKIEFIGNPDNIFRVPYIVNRKSGGYYIDYLELDERQRGQVTISNAESLIIVPSVQTKTLGFISPELAISYFWSVSVVDDPEDSKVVTNPKYLDKPIADMTSTELKAKIAEIKDLLSQLTNQLASLGMPVQEDSKIPVRSSCSFDKNLKLGLKGNDVECLQEFLKNQGSDIYPEGLVTGYFGPLTKAAVIRFQEKYAQDILAPINLIRGTGYVGKMTLAKISQLR